MKVLYEKNVLHNPLEVLRRAGYSAFTDPRTGEESFILRMTPEFYPRFHVYVEDRGNDVTINLHLDQKKPSYGTNHAHSGEYDGKTVENEMHRIDGWVKKIRADAKKPEEGEGDLLPKRPWWKG